MSASRLRFTLSPISHHVQHHDDAGGNDGDAGGAGVREGGHLQTGKVETRRSKGTRFCVTNIQIYSLISDICANHIHIFFKRIYSDIHSYRIPDTNTFGYSAKC